MVPSDIRLWCPNFSALVMMTDERVFGSRSQEGGRDGKHAAICSRCTFFFEETVTLEVLKVIGILDIAVVQGVGTCVVVCAY
jgi:hypothetical protein